MNTKNPLKIPFVTVCAAFVGFAVWQGFRTMQPPVSVAAPAATAANCEHAKASEPQALRDFVSVFPNLKNAPKDWKQFKPTELAVAPIPNASLTFRMTEYKEENERMTWTGRNEDMPLASYVFSANAGAWAGVMLMPDGSEFAMHGLPDGSVVVRKATASSLPCPVGEADVHAASASIATADVGGTLAQAAAGQPTEPELDELDQNGFYHVDLLVVVDKPFVDNLGLPGSATQKQKQTLVEATSAAYTASMNTFLQNSRIDNFRWFLAGALITPDDFVREDLSDSLNEMVNASGKIGAPARQEASRLGADQILFITSNYDISDSAVGIAVSPHIWVIDSLTGERKYKYELMPYAVAYDRLGTKTFAHELGHNFGLMHDRATDSVPDNDGNYYYGHTFHISGLQDRPGDNSTPNLDTWGNLGTIMSYSDELPFFSNPDIYLNHDDVVVFKPDYEVVLIPSGSTQLGVPAGEPKAADAARWLRENAQPMASFRRPLAFLYYPEASVSLASGATLTLSALASVGRTDLSNQDKISYQWYFNDSPVTGIASGTTHTLSILNASAANTGTYNLVATSLGGVSVWSTPSIVTVTSPPPVISSHPGSVSVAKGGTLTLSAVVSGVNLTFQWKHNGVAIAGANGPSYTKTSVTEADAGTYTLTVSNGSDPITSQPATVTVTGGTNSGGSSTSGGGGGGGASSHWFFAALLIFFTIKLKTIKIWKPPI
jgi:hypothetical protein